MKYYRLMLGQGSCYATQCFAEGFVGADFDIHRDLQNSLPEGWQEFNREFIPVYRAARPEKSKIAAGLACGMLWTICKGMSIGDVVLCPDGTGSYHVGEITGEYSYVPQQPLPHRRAVRWLDRVIDRAEISEALRRSCGSIGTICKISNHQEELHRLLGDTEEPTISSSDESIENPYNFALETHLEEFLVRNWAQTELGREYDLYEEDGQVVGRQFPTDTGPLDILAISKDKRILLVVELKKGRTADVVVGQILRYMGYVRAELAESDQAVKGVIITPEDDLRLQRALSMTPDITFYRYQVNFRLFPQSNN